MQDINHRAELETLSDVDLSFMVKNSSTGIIGASIIARAYFRERRDIAKQILQERETKRFKEIENSY